MKEMAERLTGLATGLVLTILLFSLFILFPRISYYEGEYFPVTGNVTLQILAEDDKGVYVRANFDKIRNCEFIGLNWFRFSPKGALIRVPLKFLDDGEGPVISRPVGKQEGVRWFIGVTGAELPVTLAEAKHRCHPLWQTTTQFWPVSE